MGSQVNLKALGLNYSPNNLALPEGSLITANDVIVRRDSVVESRRGFREYSQNFGGSETIHSSQLLVYKDRLINHYFNLSNVGVLSYDTGVLDANGKAIFSDFTGDFQETEDGLRIKSIQANKNLYFTTSEGIKKLAAASAATIGSSKIVNAGAVKAIDFTAELDLNQGQTTGFLGFDSAVAYRVLWGYKDVNENLILGAPSDSVSVYNYLSSVCAMDINALCNMLDKLQQNTQSYYSVIHNITTNASSETFDDTFTNTFKVSLLDSADVLKNNLIGIAENIDKFSLLADVNQISPTTFNKPLTISTLEILNNEAVIKFLPNIVTTFLTGFTNPQQIAFDVSDNLFVCTPTEVKKYNSSGTLIATYTGFSSPSGIATDSSGNAFVADTGNNVVKKIDTGGVITNFINPITNPKGIVLNSSNEVFVSSGSGNEVKKYSSTGVLISTIAGFNNPTGLDIDSSGNVYVADTGSHTIKQIDTGLSVSVFAGDSGVSGYVDANGTSAKFAGPLNIAIDSQNVIYVADTNNNRIRKIDTAKNVSTVAGDGSPSSNNGTGTNASFNAPTGIAFDSNGNVYVTETGGVTDDIRKLTSSSALNVFTVGDKIEILGTTSPFTIINNDPDSTNKKFYTLTTVTSDTIKFAITNANIPAETPTAGINIYSYNYRNIINTTQNNITSPVNAALDQTLVQLNTDYASKNVYSVIESNVYQISLRLKSELSGFISSGLQEIFVSAYNITSAANVKLTINIPESVKTNIQTNGLDYFFQIYRTENIVAADSDILGTDITPDDEMRLVYEAFPTPNELTALEAIVIDSYPSDLRGFNVNLYTNPASGEGISQANSPPPIAKDINSFKNHTFYANTKTKHILSPLNLLGTSNISDGDTIVISDGTTLGTTKYTFKEGKKEITSFTFTGITPTIAANKHFTLFSANDLNEYFVWYRLNNKNITSCSLPVSSVITITTTNDHNLEIGDKIQLTNASSQPDGTIVVGTYEVLNKTLNTFDIEIDPLITTVDVTNASFIPYFDDKKVVIVDILSADTVIEITSKTSDALNSLSLDFTSSVVIVTTTPSLVTKFVVENVSEGKTQNASATNPYGNLSAYLNIVIDQQGDGQDFSTNQVLLSRADSRSQAIDLTARSLVTVINKNLNSPIMAYYISGSNTLPGIINLEAETIQDTTFYIMANNVGTGSSFNPDIAPINSQDQATTAYITSFTAANPTEATTNGNHGLVTGDKIIINDGDITGIHTVTVGAFPNKFTIPVNSVGGTTASWSKLSDTIGSTNEEKPNRIYYSKYLIPEAVPLANVIDVGSSDKKILRIFPLRDSLFVFKEDGLFRVSGESPPFVLSLFDSSCVLIAPDSVSIANNIIYAWTNKGISNVTEAGVNEISRPIDTVILKLASASYNNFSKLTWGFGYDSDNSYTVYTNADPDDEYASIGFRFSNLTNTWTNFNRTQTCGLIRQLDDKIYTGSGIYNLIEQERKSFDRTDYSDRDFTILLTDNKIKNSGKVLSLTLDDFNEISEGDVIVQDQILTIYSFNNLLQKLDIDTPLQGNYELLKISSGANLLTSVQALAAKLDTDPALAGGYVTAITGLTDATQAFNVIINKLNGATSGTTLKNYKLATETKSFEAVVESVNKKTNEITLNLALQFVVGEFQVYKAIPCEIQYAPITFGDPLGLKQIYEATMMFNNKAFTKATASFSSDLKPEFSSIDFYGQGNGIFGSYSEPGFGFGFFGGGSNAAPFRTIIPRESQRCRFMNVKFNHTVAREIWNLYGITLTGNSSESSRAYR